jgi:hypothetical protein
MLWTKLRGVIIAASVVVGLTSAAVLARQDGPGTGPTGRETTDRMTELDSKLDRVLRALERIAQPAESSTSTYSVPDPALVGRETEKNPPRANTRSPEGTYGLTVSQPSHGATDRLAHLERRVDELSRRLDQIERRLGQSATHSESAQMITKPAASAALRP